MTGKNELGHARGRSIPCLLVLFLLLCLLAGCSIPIGVTRVSGAESYRLSTENPLNEGVPSTSTRAVLQRYDLNRAAADDPENTMRALFEKARVDNRRDILFALAELCYLYGERLSRSDFFDEVAQAPDYFLLSAVYAYLYLLGDGREPPPTAWDPRFREACEIYNRALGRGFPAGEDGSLTVGDRVRKLPVGEMTIIPDVTTLNWAMDQFSRFLPADNYKVYGLSVRNRDPGLGLPLIAVLKQSPDLPTSGALPITAFLRITGGLAELGEGRATATLELYSAYDQAQVEVSGRTVPLETDSTAQLAYRLNDADLWNLGVKRFLGGHKIDKNLLLIQPYEPGRIPVVFVHGTASSPVWWAEMLNTLRADPVIRKRFQFWFFQYNSSKMVMLSAAELRETLTKLVGKLDPQGKDPALRQMVVIGHSQGGLLTKAMAVAPGDRLWESISDTSLDDIDAGEDIKEMFRRALFFEPLPFVKRVVFIATPHRGSFRSKGWVRRVVRFLVSIPVDIVTLNPEMVTQFTDKLKLPPSVRSRAITSVDGMSPENPVLKTFVTIPLAPGVTGHSIIAVLPGMEIETGNDGVVEYASAHIEGVESEFIVRAEHSCQGHPDTIEEVRRILLEHIGEEMTDTQRVVSPSPSSAAPSAAVVPAPSPPAPLGHN